MRLTTDRGFWLALLLSIVTLGFYNLYLIHAFARETNIACRYDNRHTHGLLFYLFFNFITFGIFGICWRCEWINRCNNFLANNGESEGLQVSTYLFTIFLLGVLTAGIMYIVVYTKYLYLQNRVNSLYNRLNGLY